MHWNLGERHPLRDKYVGKVKSGYINRHAIPDKPSSNTTTRRGIRWSIQYDVFGVMQKSPTRSMSQFRSIRTRPASDGFGQGRSIL
jgi:hypothetical protein